MISTGKISMSIGSWQVTFTNFLSNLGSKRINQSQWAPSPTPLSLSRLHRHRIAKISEIFSTIQSCLMTQWRSLLQQVHLSVHSIGRQLESVLTHPLQFRVLKMRKGASSPTNFLTSSGQPDVVITDMVVMASYDAKDVERIAPRLSPTFIALTLRN